MRDFYLALDRHRRGPRLRGMRTGAIFDEAAESSSKDAENIGEDDPTTNAAPRTSWNSTFDRFYIVRTCVSCFENILVVVLLVARTTNVSRYLVASPRIALLLLSLHADLLKYGYIR